MTDWLGPLPLPALPVAFYNLFALTLAGGFDDGGAHRRLTAPLATFRTGAGGLWPVSLSDLLIAAGVVLLFVELLRAAASRRVAIANHALAMLVFLVCLVELLMAPAFATSTFFLIALMVLLDVLAGFITVVARPPRED